MSLPSCWHACGCPQNLFTVKKYVLFTNVFYEVDEAYCLTYILLFVTHIGIYVGLIAPSVNTNHNISSGGGKHAASRKQNNDGTYCCSSYTYTDTYWLFVDTLLHAKVQLQQWVSTFAWCLAASLAMIAQQRCITCIFLVDDSMSNTATETHYTCCAALQARCGTADSCPGGAADPLQ